MRISGAKVDVPATGHHTPAIKISSDASASGTLPLDRNPSTAAARIRKRRGTERLPNTSYSRTPRSLKTELKRIRSDSGSTLPREKSDSDSDRSGFSSETSNSKPDKETCKTQ
jgi:hypothetical protein